ncbi:hypothetical protein [Aquisphaera insulae]|uniref:hypothetical protein n=1 Tax=Aquisphaera insulae TaxID=2712864 RepID=UPI0013EDC4A2|nr:hypothetical protein [Aquisphaera insulae]
MSATRRGDHGAALAALDAKINALLPPRYQHCYSDVPPVSMGSAGLIYGPDGKVAWDRIWTSFCDLALAGGPPHRGKFLGPPPAAEVAADPDRHRAAVAEIDRAIGLTSGYVVEDGYAPGWVGIRCRDLAEAAWLQLAVNAENVAARRRGTILQLPAGPAFRPEKEIKNVVVALAKASHYWEDHLSSDQQSLASAEDLEPATSDEASSAPDTYRAALAALESAVRAAGLPLSPHPHVGWIGAQTADEEEAVWLLRAILVERIPVRREESHLFLPVGATWSPEQAAEVGHAFRRAWDLRRAAFPHRPAWRPSGRA